MKILKNKFYIDSFINSGGSVLVGFLGYLFNFFASRLLSVSQFGELQSLISLYSVLGSITVALSYFIIKYSSTFAASSDKSGNGKFILLVENKLRKIAWLIVALTILFAPLIKIVFHLEGYFGIFTVGVSLGMLTMGILYKSNLVAWGNFLQSNLVDLFSQAARVVVGVLLAYWFSNVGIVMSSFLISAALTLFLARYFAAKRGLAAVIRSLPSISRPMATEERAEVVKLDLSAMKKSILPIVVFSVAMILLGNADVLLMRALSTAQLTGYYSVLNLMAKIVFWVNTAVVVVVLPSACSEHHLKGKFSRKTRQQAYGILGLISLAAFLVYYFFSAFVIGLLFGVKYIVFSGPLWLFATLAFFSSILNLEANLSFARHDYKVSYFLLATVLLMALAIFKLHNNIFSLAVGLNAVMLAGYVLVIGRNFLINSKVRSQKSEV